MHPDAVDCRVTGPREGGDAQVAEVDQPDVQVGEGALAGLLPVGGAGLVLVPGVVVEAVGACQGEGETGVGRLRGLLARVGLVQHRDLVGDLLVGDVALAVLSGHDVHVDLDAGRGQRALRHELALRALLGKQLLGLGFDAVDVGLGHVRVVQRAAALRGCALRWDEAGLRRRGRGRLGGGGARCQRGNRERGRGQCRDSGGTHAVSRELSH